MYIIYISPSFTFYMSHLFYPVNNDILRFGCCILIIFFIIFYHSITRMARTTLKVIKVVLFFSPPSSHSSSSSSSSLLLTFAECICWEPWWNHVYVLYSTVPPFLLLSFFLLLLLPKSPQPLPPLLSSSSSPCIRDNTIMLQGKTVKKGRKKRKARIFIPSLCYFLPSVTV